MSRIALLVGLIIVLTLFFVPENGKSYKKDIDSDFSLNPVSVTEEVNDNEILTFQCEIITSKPKVATSFCADFGAAVWNIEWKSWSASGAVGFGIYRVNDCEPNCSEGKFREMPVKVKLEGLYTDGERFFLRNFTYIANLTSASEIPETETWDLADFYLNVPAMRN